MAAAAATAEPPSDLYRDLAARVPVGPDTLFAIIAAGQTGVVPTEVSSWAYRLYSQTAAAEAADAAQALVSAGFDPNGTEPDAFGLLDPDYDGERICAVIRASSEPGCAVDRFGEDGWEPIPGAEPIGLPYVELAGEVLADALTAASLGASLILSPSQPRGWVSGDPAVVAAGVPLGTVEGDESTDRVLSGAKLFAITDPLDTTAVVSLFAAAPGPKISVRRAGAWAPDDGTLLGQLRSISPPPVIVIPPEQATAVLRQVDDYDSTHPQTAKHPTGGMAPQAVTSAADDHSHDVMIALPVPASTARALAAHDGVTEQPEDMHVTLAYLGPTEYCPPHEKLLETVRNWAAGTPSLRGLISGGGMFTANDDGPVAVALPDLPDLPRHRQHLVDMLRAGGVTRVDSEHGFTPHITLSYDANAMIHPQNLALNFPRVALYYGDERTEVPFGWQGSDTEFAEPLVSAVAHQHLIRKAQDADSEFDRRRAESDVQEQERRRAFEEQLGSRYGVLCSEGTDPEIAAATVRREMQAEDDRRTLWERDRADELAAERARRLGRHPDIRQSAAEDPDTLVAAVAHTAMPGPLREYWLHGKGAAKIRWGTSGDFYRAVRYLAKYMDLYRAKAAANELHKLATGMWTAQHAKLDRAATGR